MKDSPQELLRKLIQQGDVAKIRQLLAEAQPPLSKADLGRALLSVLDRDKKNEAIVQLLLEQGANPEEPYILGPVLMCAAMNGALPTVKLLIKFGADPHRQFRRESALTAAMSENQTDVVEYLESLKARAEPSMVLRYAAEHGDLKRATAALAQGADINATRGLSSANTPLIAAAGNGQVEMVKFLLARGANPRKAVDYTSPLHSAVAYGESLPIAETLIAAGCPVDAAIDGETVLMVAAGAGNLASVKRLIELGANPQARNRERGMTVLDYARQGKAKAVLTFLANLGLGSARDGGRKMVQALVREYGGRATTHNRGIMVNAKFLGHKCQIHSEPERSGISIFGLRYALAEFADRNPPGLSFFSSKPKGSDDGWKKFPARQASRQLGLAVYSTLKADDPQQAALTRFCQRIATPLRELALVDGEALHLSKQHAGFAWQGTDPDTVKRRLAILSALLGTLTRPAQPERRLFDREWLIKPQPKTAAEAKATHTFGGAIDPPIACPHCGSAGNPIIRIDLTDPSLPRTKLKRRSLPVTWCLECSEWGPDFYDLSPETPKPLPVDGKPDTRPVGPALSPDRPARRMMLVPVPPGKKAGRKSKIGGSPSWVQNDDTPDCPTCTKPMAFVLQMASDSQISYVDEGLLYVFACPECRTMASLIQSH